MSTRPFEGHTFAYALAAVPANPDAPTAAQIDAGVPLVSGMTANGLNASRTDNTVSTPMMDGYVRQNVGTQGDSYTLQFIYDPDTADLAAIYDWFDTQGKTGALVICEAAAAVGVACEVYPCTFGEAKMISGAPDTDKQFTVRVAVNAPPSRRATVAL